MQKCLVLLLVRYTPTTNYFGPETILLAVSDRGLRCVLQSVQTGEATHSVTGSHSPSILRTHLTNT